MYTLIYLWWPQLHVYDGLPPADNERDGLVQLVLLPDEGAVLLTMTLVQTDAYATRLNLTC
jgi:hypothetical protein